MVLWVAEGSLCFPWCWLEHHDGWNVQNGLTYVARSSELLAVCLDFSVLLFGLPCSMVAGFQEETDPETKEKPQRHFLT